ncbi:MULTISPECIES: branched-chain amino acid ABC transporter permease [Acidovorax]|jgi:branched-chain amino acid transport system permease protein|uniref:Branched-chain amino acid ABC transporter permease n=1 Tax=Acidovorax facilis TaxID=12917 RepID=A0ABV8D462_9BURK|nr:MULTISPECIES: branched-chain amino acid ABC transporter permease [Acidovorax]KQB57902.1 ABC transporter permease [Acidovorax sp. SD340]MBO1006280.1 branched-chain amino acid ABC transporter permease [Acidovorax sp. SD340]MCO4239871.1 branched-chain amino acid ABC transporter permease [Acidovorax facilis]QLA83015.1 branched-chain amino acid ABC transporter permease [Acidovorax sp. JMULE5]
MKKYTHFILAAVVVLTMPLLMHSGSLASEVLIFALAAMGCNLLLGFTGLLSFGQGIFFGLGSYTVALMLSRWAVPMPLALLLATLMGALGAALVGWVAIRQRGTYFVMLTLAFSQMFYFIAYTATDLTGGDNGLMDVPRPNLSLFGADLWTLATPWQFYGFVSLLFLIVFWLLLRVSNSTFGRTLLAVRDNEERAAAIGYNLRLLKLQAFVISGAVTGLAGALHAMMTGLAPLSNAELHTSEMILIMTVIGGTGNLFASLLGSAFYLLLADWLSQLWPRWLLLLGVALIAVSLWMQRGLWGLGEMLWRKLQGQRNTATAATAKGEQA